MTRTADGICGIQPYLVPGEESALVPPINAYLATATLIQQCAGGNPPMGGQARDFGEWSDHSSTQIRRSSMSLMAINPGGDNNLLVTVGEYDPHLWSDNVRCFGSTGGVGIVQSCNLLADEMEANESPKTFGPSSRTQRQRIITPYTRTASE